MPRLPVAAALAFVLFQLPLWSVGCSHSLHANDLGAPTDDASASGPCTDGDHRCNGALYEKCAAGSWMQESNCGAANVCSPTLGCTQCPPSGYGCDGDNVVACDQNGKPTKNVTQNCSPSTCIDGACAPPCSKEALAHSNIGCIYFATDLPQITFNAGAGDGALQQFAVAVANPWPVAVDCVVERNDAKVGAPAQIVVAAHQTIPPNSLATIPLPSREVDGYIPGKAPNRSMVSAAAYRITTDRPTSAWQFNPLNVGNAFSNDASMLVPVNALDESYAVLGWEGVSTSFAGLQVDEDSFLTITATRANTHVRVTPTAPVSAGDGVPELAKGQPFVVTLNEFETLNLHGGDPFKNGNMAPDFTGSRVEADGPVAVWSGVECTSISAPNSMADSCCCDHLEEQLFPRSSLGANYVVMRSPPRGPEGEYFRVLAVDDNTVVQTSLPSPDDKFTLQKGQMHQIFCAQDFTVEASHPVMIGQYLLSQQQTTAYIGDPSFILIPPIAQYRPRYIFLVPSGYQANFVVMAVARGASPTIDGAAAQGCTRNPVGTVGGKDYDTLLCPVKEGTHTITDTAAFGITVHGYGAGPVSYGYPGGMEFAPVNQDCTNDSDCPNAEFFCAGGTCAPVIQ